MVRQDVDHRRLRGHPHARRNVQLHCRPHPRRIRIRSPRLLLSLGASHQAGSADRVQGRGGSMTRGTSKLTAPCARDRRSSQTRNSAGFRMGGPRGIRKFRRCLPRTGGSRNCAFLQIDVLSRSICKRHASRPRTLVWLCERFREPPCLAAGREFPSTSLVLCGALR